MPVTKSTLIKKNNAQKQKHKRQEKNNSVHSCHIQIKIKIIKAGLGLLVTNAVIPALYDFNDYVKYEFQYKVRLRVRRIVYSFNISTVVLNRFADCVHLRGEFMSW